MVGCRYGTSRPWESVYRTAPYRAVLCWAALYRLVSYRRIQALRAPKLGSLQCLPAWENATSTWGQARLRLLFWSTECWHLGSGKCIYMYICTHKPFLCPCNCCRRKNENLTDIKIDRRAD